MLQEALEHLVKGIVDHPDDVRDASHGLRRGRVLEVRVRCVRSSARWQAGATSGWISWTWTRSGS